MASTMKQGAATADRIGAPDKVRAAGVLCGKARTSDPIDATVVLAAEPGDRIVTSDPRDIATLADVAGVAVTIAAC